MHTIRPLVDAAALSQQHCPTPLKVQLAYYGHDNFLGRPAAGYHLGDACFVTPKVATALCDVQNEVLQDGLSLFIFDAYRPLRAVKDFAQWFKQPINTEQDKQRKAIHYPNLEKQDLEPNGYIAGDVSRHCYGYAVDLSLVDLTTGKLLDMGACFDYFDTIAHLTAKPELIGKLAYANRQYLCCVMEKHGFIPYDFEYWHFDYHVHELKQPLDVVIDQNL